MILASSAVRRFYYLFRLWSCFLVFIFLPFDVIYRIDSFLLSMSAADIIVNIAAMLLIMVGIAAVLALVATPCSLVASRLGVLIRSKKKPDVTKDPSFITHYLLLFYSCYAFSKLLKTWMIKFHYEIAFKSIFIGLLLSVIIFWRNRANFHERSIILINTLTRRCALPTLWFLAFVIISWRIGAVTIRQAMAQGTNTVTASDNAKPNIFLVTFDALSAEDMSLYGYTLHTTPNIDAFAKECYVFDHAVAASNWTRPSVVSLLTGKYPATHKFTNFGFLPSNTNTAPQESLPAYLKKIGYRTSAFVSNWEYAHPYANGIAVYFDDKPFTGIEFGNLHIGSRFVYSLWKYFLPFESRYGICSFLWFGELFKDWNYRMDLFFNLSNPLFPPDLIFQHIKDFNQADYRNKPVMLWFHVLTPSAPYFPPRPFKGHFLGGDDLSDPVSVSRLDPGNRTDMDRLRLRYDENILYSDAAFGEFIQSLRQSGWLDDSIVIVSADHGESFGHGYQGHGGPFLYQSLVRVPLLVHMPGQKKGKRLDAVVSLIDIAPTILDLLGYSIPGWMEGMSLKSAMEANSPVSRPIFTMNLDGNNVRGKITKGSAAVIEGDYKYIHYLNTGKGELYHLKDDPQEKNNLVESEAGRMRRMSRQIFDRIGMSGRSLPQER